jgi:hypothetical protein
MSVIMDVRLLSFAIRSLIFATTTIILAASLEASYAQNMVYEVQHIDFRIATVSTPSLGGIGVGDDFFAVATVVNESPIQNVSFITQDINSNGTVDSIEINANLTLPADSVEIANRWIPMSCGGHTIEGFLLQMDSNNNPTGMLVEKLSVATEVVRKCQS